MDDLEAARQAMAGAHATPRKGAKVIRFIGPMGLRARTAVPRMVAGLLSPPQEDSVTIFGNAVAGSTPAAPQGELNE